MQWCFINIHDNLHTTFFTLHILVLHISIFLYRCRYSLITSTAHVRRYGAPATTTSPPGTTLSPAVEKFKALVNTEVTALWNGVHHDTDGNLDQGDLDALFKGYDDDGNQQISQSEFLAHFSHNQQNLVVIAQGLFYELDMDNDNEITKSDMQRYYEKIDKNDDGSVDQAEFESYFKDTLTLLFVLQFESQMSTTPAST
ncbi:hypothetical protein KP79_PYT04605 [Mizuhopecten yessoensis]|uniref:EF-hand domain-containing protein n=1 Tax=Mizuhopecten yessoensis TaxID=6573 RepID=A0A210QS96_MIZYE|nr:hypothetical protein KP79_PYT04605 [Mizuhopecten yessoensis]